MSSRMGTGVCLRTPHRTEMPGEGSACVACTEEWAGNDVGWSATDVARAGPG